MGIFMAAQSTEKPSQSTDRMPAWHTSILVALMAAQIFCATFSSTASTDTNRDIYFAQQIASARDFPLIGPQINGMLHLGPVWFYVLAIAAWLIPNAAAVTAFMAAIGSLQFPLAYRLGLRFGSPREGLLFAIALALPGFMAVSLVSLTHTIAVIPCLLLGVFAAMAYRARPDWKHALWLGVAAALALNAHPTTLLLITALILWGAVKTGSAYRWVFHGLLVAAPVLLSMAPMLYAQWQDGFADAMTATRYTHNALSFPSLSNGLFLIYADLWYGPKYMLRFWLDMPPVPSRWLFSIYALVLIAASIGALWRVIAWKSQRKLVIVLLGLLILQSVFVCAIRPDMPPWMIYAQWPLIAALLALGLEQICSVTKFGVTICLTVTTGWSIAIWTHMAAGSLDLSETKPAYGKLPLMADVRHYTKARNSFRMPRIPFRQLYAIGQPLCEPVTLFGHYAYLIDVSYGIGTLQSCGNRESIQLGGPPDPKRRLQIGLREEAWTRLQMKPAHRVGVIGVSAPTAIWQSLKPLYPETPRLSTWPHRIAVSAHRFVIEGVASADQAVLIANRANRYVPFSVAGAKVNGAEIVPVYEDLMTAVYRTPSGFTSDEARWRIEVEGAPEYVDALTFATAN